MSRYAEMVAEDRRLILLQALHEVPDYALRETTMLRLLEGERLAIDQDGLRRELRHLADEGLLEIEYHDGVQAARITARGADVAAGRTRVSGIARPRP